MENHWHAIDLLMDVSVDTLEQEIAQQRIDINTSLGIDEQAKEQRLQQLAIAEEAHERASQNTATKAEYQRRITDLNAGLERLKLEAKQSAKPQSVDHNLSIDAMQSMLRDLQAKLRHEKTSALKTLDKIQHRDERMNTIPGERLDKLNEVTELHEELIREQATGTSDVISLLAIRARELAANTKVQSLEQEANWHDLSQEWLPLEKTIHQRQIQRLELELKSWNTLIANRKKAELERQIRLAHQKAVEAHPSLRALSEQTTLLTEARSALATKMGELHNETLIVSKQEDSVKKQRTDLETSIKDIGKDDSSGLLIQVHRNLIRPYEGMARIQEMENELRLSRGKVLKLRSEQEPLSHPETYIPDSLNIHHDVAVADTTLIALANEAIETHRQQLTALVGDNEDYQKLLNEVLPKRKSLLAEIAATRELVDTCQRILRSRPVAGSGRFNRRSNEEPPLRVSSWHARVDGRVCHRSQVQRIDCGNSKSQPSDGRQHPNVLTFWSGTRKHRSHTMQRFTGPDSAACARLADGTRLRTDDAKR
jgi:hypothetical protein